MTKRPWIVITAVLFLNSGTDVQGAPVACNFPTDAGTKRASSQLPQLINADGSLNKPQAITPVVAPTSQPSDTSFVVTTTPTDAGSTPTLGLAERIHAIGEKISSDKIEGIPDSIRGVAENAANRLTNAFREAGEQAAGKLKEFKCVPV